MECNDKIIFACANHVEIALDDFVNFNESAPIIEKCNNEKCNYCDAEATYKITK